MSVCIIITFISMKVKDMNSEWYHLTSPKSNLWGPHKSVRLRQNSSYSFLHICMFGIKIYREKKTESIS